MIMKYKTDGGRMSHDDPSYVERESDSTLQKALIDRLYCYIFAARQMGKTSLLFRTKKHLEALGHKCVKLELTHKADNFEQWCKNMTRSLGKELKLLSDEELESWLNKKKPFSISTYLDFIDEIVLEKIESNIYIYYDKIDIAKSLAYSIDSFLLSIKRMYEKRQTDRRYERLTFVFSGVTTPDNLIRNKSNTCLNIGKAIKPTGIKLENSEHLLDGLKHHTEKPRLVLREIIEYTGGQPFLTQQFCEKVQEKDFVPSGEEKKCIKEIVDFYRDKDNWKNPEIDNPKHFRTIEEVIKEKIDNNDPNIIEILIIYREILENGYISTENLREYCDKLFGWGLIKEEGGKARVSSPLYKEIFNEEWVNKHIDSRCPWSKEINNWSASLKKDKKNYLLREKKKLEEFDKWASNNRLTQEQTEYRWACNVESNSRKYKKNTLGFLLGTSIMFVGSIYVSQFQRIENVERYAPDKKIARGNFSWTCDDIRIESDSRLFAYCWTSDGRRLPTYFNSNKHIENIDGNLEWSRIGNYAHSCRNYEVEFVVAVGSNRDAYLVSECARLDGSWKTTRLNLNERIDNTNGELRYYL